MYREMIQKHKIQYHVFSIDFDSNCTHFVTGGREHIRIFDFNLSKDCWFDTKKIITKYKGVTMTMPCVSQLSWNKEGRDALAIGSTSGYVSVYDANHPYKSLMLIKGHQGNIKNIEWTPGSRDRFVSACSGQNQIIEWDVRQENKVFQYQFNENTKIRDVKFNPHKPELLAVQSFNKLQLLDLRKGSDSLATYEILSNQMQGIGVQWDPINPSRIASAISSKICVFDVSSNIFEFVQSIAHYALIKSFYWMKTKPTFFGIMGQHLQKNLSFYDLQDKNRMAYMYAGHTKYLDCWKMNNDQTIVLSVSNHKDKVKTGVTATNQYAALVAQYTQNFFDPNQSKFNYPIAFDNDSDIAFCLNLDGNKDPKKSLDILKKRNSMNSQTTPAVYHFRDITQWFERDKEITFPMSLKEEIIFLDRHYKIQELKEENNEKISLHNSDVAARIGKTHCAEMWKNLFQISFPPQEEEITLETIYQRKLKLNIAIVDNRVILSDQKQKIKPPHRIQISSVLQWLIDEHNQIQTAALAIVCLMSRNPDLLPQEFVFRVFTPYIELLRCLQLFEIAAKTIIMTKSQRYTKITQNDTKFTIQCGSCKSYASKGDCKCNLLCVICQGRLSEGLVIWCKYCGHGGHAKDYEKWFKIDKKRFCPHGCGHTCFQTEE